MKTANEKLEGDDNDAKRRRNALVNALTSHAPTIESGKATVNTVVRDILYAVAPVYLWQCFSSQGKSGTSKSSLAKEMPQIYRAILAATTNRTSLNNLTIISTIGMVIRSCPTRAESRAYRREHPELFSDMEKSHQSTSGQKEIPPFVNTDNSKGKTHFKAQGEKILLSSSEEDCGEDSDIPVSSPESEIELDINDIFSPEEDL